MRTLISIMPAMILLSSCYSYKIYPKEYRNFSYTGKKEEAFILNPELTKELQILKKAGIFIIVKDTLDTSVVKIRLHSLQKDFVCGQPVTASLVTLGQVPVLLPDKYRYEFDEVRLTDTTQKRYELKIATRFWFWDMFAMKKDFNQKAGQTLLAEYYNN